MLRNAAGNPLSGATIELIAPGYKASSVTRPDGSFSFEQLPPSATALCHRRGPSHGFSATDRPWGNGSGEVILILNDQGAVSLQAATAEPETTGGVALSSHAVSQLPLNKRDFSQLLLLAAGTMTDANGATNFTQQFAINGQRGVEATFAMDGADISDPEMGGSTFSNFNVDAVEADSIPIRAGCRPRSAAEQPGLTNIVTRSGSSGFHGSFFEFLRNSALDARNYFDHSSIANPGRLPPFRRNEFGFTNGGPVILPHLQRRRQDLLLWPVPGLSPGARHHPGISRSYGGGARRPGQHRISRRHAVGPGRPGHRPCPRALSTAQPSPGSLRDHTYASSSPVVTDANQFSLRLDHRISDRSQFFARFNFNNLNGPTTNPDQTAIDPTFGIRYIDRQRNLVVTYTRTVSPRLVLESSASVTRSTPSFPTTDLTDPAVKFNDGSYEPFNQPAGTVISLYGNLFQGRQNVSFTTASHAFKAGGEVRLNRDTTYFGISPNGEYDFGGGTAYSPMTIPSQSGLHDIRVGDPLPDTLSGLLSGSPFFYTVAVAPTYFSGGAAHRSRGHQPKQLLVFCPGHVEDLAAPGAGLRPALRPLYADLGARETNLRPAVFHPLVPNSWSSIRSRLSFQSRWPGAAGPTRLAGRRADSPPRRRRNYHHPA